MLRLAGGAACLAALVAFVPVFRGDAGAKAAAVSVEDANVERRVWHRLSPGDRLSYRVEYHNVTKTDMRPFFQGGASGGAGGDPPPGFGPQTLTTTVKGTLNLRVLDRRETGFLVSYDIPGAEALLSTDGLREVSRSRELRENLGRIMLAEVGFSGRVLTVRFQPETDPYSRTVAKVLLSWGQFSPPEAGPAESDRWEATEEDPSGRYVAEYRLAGKERAGPGAQSQGTVTFRKRKLRYLGTPAKRTATRVVISPAFRPSGESTVVFDFGKGCLYSLSGKETVEAFMDGSRVAQSRTTVRLRLLKREVLPDGELVRRREEALGIEPTYVAEGMSEPSGKREAEIAKNRQALGGSTADDLIARLAEVEGKAGEPEGTELFLKLRALASLDPEGCRKVGDAAFSGPAGSDAFRLAANAYASSGSEAAQEALVYAIRARRSDPDAFLQLVTTLARIGEPTAATAEALGGIAFDPSAGDRESRLALLAYGAAASNLRETEANLADRMVDRLLRGLEAADDSGTARKYLDALGNAGSERSFPALKRLSADPRPEMRGNVLMAMRRIDTEEADQALFHALLSDPEPQVRTAAANALGFRVMTDSRFRTQEAAFRKEPDPSIRILLLNNLWVSREAFPAARRIAREAAGKDPSQDVRNHAARLLGKSPGPEKDGGSGGVMRGGG